MKIVAAAALFMLAAFPAFAQSPNQLRLEGNGPTSPRESVIRACSERAQKFQQTTYGNLQAYQYRTCMALHGQPE